MVDQRSSRRRRKAREPQAQRDALTEHDDDFGGQGEIACAAVERPVEHRERPQAPPDQVACGDDLRAVDPEPARERAVAACGEVVERCGNDPAGNCDDAGVAAQARELDVETFTHVTAGDPRRADLLHHRDNRVDTREGNARRSRYRRGLHGQEPVVVEASKNEVEGGVVACGKAEPGVER
jgi:hypothetical protein